MTNPIEGVRKSWKARLRAIRADPELIAEILTREDAVLAEGKKLGIIDRDWERGHALLDTEADRAVDIVQIEQCIKALLAGI